MDAALGLGETAPAAGARIFAGAYALGAGHASDRHIPLCDQRVPRQVAGRKDSLDLGARPAGERVDLDPASVIHFDQWKCDAGGPLIALATGYPGAKTV